MLLALAEQNKLDHFAYRADKLDIAAATVAEEIRRNYPTLDVPYHSRWRHFEVGGIDRWAQLAPAIVDPTERARARIDLAVVSVLLDAGAGAAWSYREAATGQVHARSEGLAVASFAMFAAGAFSARAGRKLQADASGLQAFDQAALTQGFQVTTDNPLVGLAGRASLINALGRALAARPDLFGANEPRTGRLTDHFQARARGGALPASDVLAALLDGLSSIWPGRIELGGVNLGDVWRHPGIKTGDLTDGLVPFHKLSQWLAYSLLEPLEEAGIGIVDLDALTGLPEYRNGGLLIDLGVLVPRDPGALDRVHRPADVFVVEWRALTVALLDRLAQGVRTKLGVTAASFPLARVLQGGTWSAGRSIAAELRPGGAPPIRLDSDGTVF
ncbi:MAG: DUF1688 family protein [Alphaproteobacteria bacterium]|nr:DUF1688 family protein [Alphaproteobacteria bacterium]